MGWNVAHLMVLSAWGGLVAGKIVMELLARRSPHLQRPVAELHRAIDVKVGVFILVTVVATGAILLTQRNINWILVVKVVAGIGAVMCNIHAVGVVKRRASLFETDADSPELPKLTGRLFRLGRIGLACAAVALVLGAYRGGWF